MATKADLHVAIAGIKTRMISKDRLVKTINDLEGKNMQQVNRLEQQVKCLALELASKTQKIEEHEKSMQSKLETMLKASIASAETNSSNGLWSSIAANGRGKSVEEVKVAKAIAAVSKENYRKEKSIVAMGLPVSTQPDVEQQRNRSKISLLFKKLTKRKQSACFVSEPKQVPQTTDPHWSWWKWRHRRTKWTFQEAQNNYDKETKTKRSI
jgi:hypothetical protein